VTMHAATGKAPVTPREMWPDPVVHCDKGGRS
jgi:hypothetical protein